MFQNLLADHVARLAPFVTPTFVVNAAPHFRNVAAPSSLRAEAVGRVGGTPAANDFISFGAMVADPQLRGRMVLSYEFQWSCQLANNATIVLPMLVDIQSAAPLAANVVTLFAAAADVSWSLPPLVPFSVGGQVTFGFRGRALVDTSITSATPGITTRQFGVGACVRCPAGASDFSFAAQIALYADQDAFFQPFK